MKQLPPPPASNPPRRAPGFVVSDHVGALPWENAMPRTPQEHALTQRVLWLQRKHEAQVAELQSDVAHFARLAERLVVENDKLEQVGEGCAGW